MNNFKQLFETVAEYNELEKILNSPDDECENGEITKYKSVVENLNLYKPRKEQLGEFLTKLKNYCSTPENEQKLKDLLEIYKSEYQKRDFIIFCQEVYTMMNQKV